MTKPKTLLVALGLSLSTVLGAAFASPAQDLFDQANQYLVSYYDGFSAVTPASLAVRFQPELDAACATQVRTCPFTAAAPVVKKMVESLDDGHSYFLTAEQRAADARTRSGQGSPTPKIGVTLGEVKDSSDILIIDVNEGSPGEKAGLLRGDRIAGLDGQPSSAFGDRVKFQDELIKTVSSGKTVRLKVVRAGSQQLELSLTGELPKGARLPSLKVLPNSVGLIRIPDFLVQNQVGAKVHELVRSAQAQGLTKLVVDLRANPGGLATETVVAAGAFLSRAGYIGESRDGRDATVWQNGRLTSGFGGLMRQPALWTGPVVVLVNKDSYSGAEYFAQFLQDAGRALVIGEATGGLCNTAAQEIPLVDGSALEITVTRSLRLDGRPLPERVTPDIAVKDDLDELGRTGRDLVLERALQELAKAR